MGSILFLILLFLLVSFLASLIVNDLLNLSRAEKTFYRSILLLLAGCLGAIYINGAHAQAASVIITPQDNPCNEIYSLIDAENQLDTGHDENFERIKQQNNREIVMRCQQWQESYTRSAPSVQYYDYRRGY
jgi:hypothetical protein